jgi:hypothetical protein
VKNQIQVFIAVLLTGLMLAAVPTQAQDGERTMAEIRADLGELIVRIRIFDNVCVVIGSALFDELRAEFSNARKLIAAGKGNLQPLLAAMHSRARSMHLELTGHVGFQCAVPPGFMVLRVTGLAEEIAKLDELDDRKREKIAALLTATVTLLDADGILGKTEDLSGVGCLTPLGTLIGQIGDLIPVIGQSSSLESLRQIKTLLGRGITQIKSCLRTLKEVTKLKKFVLKNLREVYELLRAGNFGGRGASAVFDLTAGAIKVYTADGRSLATQTSALNLDRLVNGVYLLITDKRIRKVVVSR